MGPDGGSGYAEAAAVDASTIDAAAIGAEAAVKARATANAVVDRAGRLPGRPRGIRRRRHPRHARLPRLLAPWPCRRSRSFVEIGKRIGSDLVTISDDGRDPAGLPLWFDYEGVAKQRVPWSRPGLCRGVVYDARPLRGTACSRPGTASRRPTRTARSR